MIPSKVVTPLMRISNKPVKKIKRVFKTIIEDENETNICAHTDTCIKATPIICANTRTLER